MLVDSGIPQERRRKPDRRRRTVRALLQGGLRPRRRGLRRGADTSIAAIDGNEARWLIVGVLTLALSCTDGLLTLTLLGRGAYEVNPLMAALLAQESLWPFAAAKIGLTAAGVGVLTALARLSVFGRIRVSAILCGVFGLYAALVLYEIGMLAAAP